MPAGAMRSDVFLPHGIAENHATLSSKPAKWSVITTEKRFCGRAKIKRLDSSSRCADAQSDRLRIV